MKREHYNQLKGERKQFIGYEMETYTDYEVINPLIEKVLKGLEHFFQNLAYKVYKLHSKYNIKEVQKEREVAIWGYLNSDYK
jgi:glucosamine 6-phosphate synthetase-like amidotransferase/phosphosugar isomerase protein